MYFDTGAYTFPDYQKAWVADTWSAGIADECYCGASLYPIDNTFHHLMFIELMMRLHWGLYFIMLHQLGRSACVFSQDEIGFLQDADGTKSHVLQIAYRSRYYI